jgi:TetR/AcrR family transcriptional regulator, mexCD-oprJ operon repressor
MSESAPRPALQQRVAAAILEGAARTFAERGEQASMNDVAAAAGVARATVYRYFPNRQALFEELAQAALSDADSRLASARIDEVAPEEGVARAVRALIDVGDSFVLVARDRMQSDPQLFDHTLAQPLRHLFERGQAGGDIRNDIASSRLTESLLGLIVGGLLSTPALGKEDTIATITGLFLDGARARGPRRDQHAT